MIMFIVFIQKGNYDKFIFGFEELFVNVGMSEERVTDLFPSCSKNCCVKLFYLSGPLLPFPRNIHVDKSGILLVSHSVGDAHSCSKYWIISGSFRSEEPPGKGVKTSSYL